MRKRWSAPVWESASIELGACALATWVCARKLLPFVIHAGVRVEHLIGELRAKPSLLARLVSRGGLELEQPTAG